MTNLNETCGHQWDRCVAGNEHICGLERGHLVNSANRGRVFKRRLEGSSDSVLRLWVYLRSIEVVTIKLSVARFEKAAGRDSLNGKLAEVGTD